MSEQKINLDEYVDRLPLAVAIHRSEIKSMLREFAKGLLELAAENAEIEYELKSYSSEHQVIINKQSILNTINQVI